MMTDLRDEVAAHQAECLCHAVVDSCDGGICAVQDGPREVLTRLSREPMIMGGRYRMLVALDSTGQEWHIDPLCKVRPGRMVEA